MIKIKETMIQRIQSVYLLVVTILIIICLCSPVGSYIGSDYSVSALTNLCLTMADGTKDYAPWALFVILLVVAVLAFGTIFLFKKRMLQIRLTIFSTILLIGYYATLVTFIFMLKEESMTFWIGLPSAPLVRMRYWLKHTTVWDKLRELLCMI